MKLSQATTELLAELDQDQLKAVMEVVEHIVKDIEAEVLSLPLTKDSETEVLHRKARAEGARKVLTSALLILKLKKLV